MSKVADVTKAICANRSDYLRCDYPNCGCTQEPKQARAAIAAMREPTKEMIDEAWRWIGSNLRYEEVYPHLIDAALKGQN